MPTNKYQIRKKNTELLLRCIYNHKSISRTDIAINSGLTKPTITDITKDLIQKKIIIEDEIGKSSDIGGRRPIDLIINPNFGYFVGMDVGIRAIRITILSFDSSIISNNIHHIEDHETFDYSKVIISIMEDIEKSLPPSIHGILGLTLGILGTVFNNKIIFTPNYDVKILECIHDKFDFPVHLKNAANLASLGQAQLTGKENLILLTLRTGVGSGYVIDNKIYQGTGGKSGEIGHTIIVPDGRACRCGKKGCFEQYASDQALLQDYRILEDDDSLTYQNFISNLTKGNKNAVLVYKNFVKYIAIALVNLVQILDITDIYITGNIVEMHPDIYLDIEREVKDEHGFSLTITNTDFLMHSFSYGACIYSLNFFIENSI